MSFYLVCWLRGFFFLVRQQNRLYVSDSCAKNDRCGFITRNGSIDFIECFKINVLYLKFNTTKN